MVKNSWGMKRVFLVLLAVVLTSGALFAQENMNKSRMYNKSYRADIEISWHNPHTWGISSSHGYSFGNGLYAGGGVGFTAEYTEYKKNPVFLLPLFGDVKYSFLNKLVTPYVSVKAGGYADVTTTEVQGVRIFTNPAIGIDIHRFSLEVGYEYQLGCWGYKSLAQIHQVKCSVGFNF
jgi:hypothetical protein